jgi:hypothetical protein
MLLSMLLSILLCFDQLESDYTARQKKAKLQFLSKWKDTLISTKKLINSQEEPLALYKKDILVDDIL